MKRILKLEEWAQLALAFYLLSILPVHLSWWGWVVLFFAPDLSMIGYAVNSKTGAVLYNLVHHKALAAALILAGLVFDNHSLQAGGVLLWAHSAFDRILNYGLKYSDSFQHTHLGMIGQKR